MIYSIHNRLIGLTGESAPWSNQSQFMYRLVTFVIFLFKIGEKVLPKSVQYLSKQIKLQNRFGLNSSPWSSIKSNLNFANFGEF